MPLFSRRNRILLTSLLGLVWLLSLVIGLRSLFSYETTPGRSGQSPESWPLDSRIAREPGNYTLVMLAHPHCPCTRASVAELAHIMAQTQGKLRTYVLFLKPENSGSDWDDTPLRQAAAAIPGVTVLTDVAGSEARRFGAETSGHALLFDAAGKRLFSGGITASRGHAGENPGENAVVALVHGRAAGQNSTLVFGCGLSSGNEKTN